MRNVCLLSVCLVLTMLAGTAAAQSGTDEILSMARAGVNEEVLLAYVETAHFGYLLTPADIIQLKDAKVPDRVVLAMLHHRSGPVTQPAPEAPPVESVRAPAYSEPPRDYSYQPERVVAEPATTVIYDSPYYPSSYYASYPYAYSYGYPYCYGGYYPGLYLNVGFGSRCWGNSCFHGFHHGGSSFSGGFGVSGFASSHNGGSFSGSRGFANFSGHGTGGGGGFAHRR